MRQNLLIIILISIVIFGCSEKSEKTLQTGNWLFELQIDKTNPNLTIPFNVEVINQIQLIVKNANERIEVRNITYKKDSVFIKMPVFGSEFKGKMAGKNISGNYYNYNKAKVTPIPFTAQFGITDRFENTEITAADFSEKWQTNFISGKDSSAAIGIFKQTKNRITGTFQTETGDYRYLQGIVNGKQMKLSCFDGAHAFLFTAQQDENGNLKGMFYSGNTWKQEWTAVRNENPQLADMKTLTFLKPGYDKFAFSFPNVKGETISLEDDKYKNKVILVQIFGTWCPNCMDETKYLVELHKIYNSSGLEIIGLDFETKTDFDYFETRIERFRKDLNVPYELVLAGLANKKLAAETLPMLNKVISYPTAIFIDKSRNVREIHTGFSGPGTGENYEHYKKETEELIEKLLRE